MVAATFLSLAGPVFAGGEAGAISLRDQGFFFVGVHPKDSETPGRNGGPPTKATVIEGQMHVGFQLVARKRHPYPLVLVHGGGGQATDWMGTPDGRDGWLDYFLAAGFDVPGVKQVVHGLLLLVVTVYMPNGLWPPIARALGFGPRKI